MRKAIEDVTKFHKATGAGIGDVRSPDASVSLELRVNLIAEEFDELLEALDGGLAPPVANAVAEWLRRRASAATCAPADPPDLLAVADALADLAYVTVGANVEWGIPGADVWDEVQKANMAKAGGPVREDGKRMKPPGWKPPDIEGVLERAARNARAREQTEAEIVSYPQLLMPTKPAP